MKKTIIIVTNGFPINGEEVTFLAPEIEVLKKVFNIKFVTRYNFREQEYLDERFQVIECGTSISIMQKIICVIGGIFSRTFIREVCIAMHCKRLSIRVFLQIITDFGMAYYLNPYLQQAIEESNQSQDIIIYSYWYDYGVISAFKYAEKYNNIKVITRVHGFDLYKERRKTNYQTLKVQFHEKLDGIYPISNFGKQYYLQHYFGGQADEKVAVHYLGTNATNQISFLGSDVVRLVSCSSVIPIKRLDIIIESLSKFQNIRIEWTHIGGGCNLTKMQSLAKQLLGQKSNISYRFMGEMKNNEVLNIYRNNCFDCFILISDTEGLPFVIIEAMSFGIPVIANNVGGISEIVNNGNGFLLPQKPNAEMLASAISKYEMLSLKQINTMRENAYYAWNTNFNSKVNAERFCEKLKEISL